MGKLRELLDDIDPTGSPLEHARFIRLVIRASLISFAVWSLGTFNYLGFTNTGFVKAGNWTRKSNPLLSRYGLRSGRSPRRRLSRPKFRLIKMRY